MTSKIIYQGQLHTLSTHINSGSTIETDAPLDNNGKGEAFSPTDLVANALGCCIITIMGMKAESMNINLEGTTLEITKKMQANPRRIAEIDVVINIPALQLDDKAKTILERAGLTCPVAQSLSSELVKNISFNWA